MEDIDFNVNNVLNSMSFNKNLLKEDLKMKKIDGFSSLVVRRNEISSISDFDLHGKDKFQKLIDAMDLDARMLDYIDEVFSKFPSVDNISNIMFNLLPRFIDARKFDENFANLSLGFNEMTDDDGFTITTLNDRVVVLQGLRTVEDKPYFDVRMSFDTFISVGRGIVLEITEMANVDGKLVENDDDVDMPISTNELEILGGVKVSNSVELNATQKLNASHNYNTNVVSLDSVVGGQSVNEKDQSQKEEKNNKKQNDEQQDVSGASAATIDAKALNEFMQEFDNTIGEVKELYTDANGKIQTQTPVEEGAGTSGFELSDMEANTVQSLDSASQYQTSVDVANSQGGGSDSSESSGGAQKVVNSNEPGSNVNTQTAGGDKYSKPVDATSTDMVAKSVIEKVNNINKNLFGDKVKNALTEPEASSSLASTPIVSNTLSASVASETSSYSDSGCGSNLYSDLGSFSPFSLPTFTVCSVDILSIDNFRSFFRPTVSASRVSEEDAPPPVVESYTCYNNNIDPVESINDKGELQNIKDKLSGSSDYVSKYTNWVCGVDTSYGGTSSGANAYCGVNNSYLNSGQIYDWTCVENYSVSDGASGSDIYCGVNRSYSGHTYTVQSTCITNYSATGTGLSVGTYCNPNLSTCGIAMSVGTFCAANASACATAASTATICAANASVCGAAASIATVCAANASACGANFNVATVCAANASACATDMEVAAACFANASACGANMSVATLCAANASACAANVAVGSVCTANVSACGSKITAGNACAVDAKACGAKADVGACGVDVGATPVGVRVWCGVNTGLDPLSCCIINVIPILPSC